MMMTKIFMMVFTLLTVITGYLTFNDIGLQDTNFSDKSVRSGSSGTSGYRHGK